MFEFRVRLFSLGFITALFNPDQLVELIREGCADGYRLLRREFRVERQRFLFFFPRLAFGMVFRRDQRQPDVEHDYRVAVYKTRFFTRTVDPDVLGSTLNRTAAGGFELYFGIKYPTRFLGIFPRETYTFIFRKPYAGTLPAVNYRIIQTPYRFFTRTMDAELFESDLKQLGKSGGQLKITFRDERRVLGLVRQPTVVTVAEVPASATGLASVSRAAA